MTANIKTTVRLPAELDKQLTEYAQREDLSKNQVIKQALRKVLGQSEDTA